MCKIALVIFLQTEIALRGFACNKARLGPWPPSRASEAIENNEFRISFLGSCLLTPLNTAAGRSLV